MPFHNRYITATYVQGTANSPTPVAIIDGDKVRSGMGDNLMGAMARPLELTARLEAVTLCNR